MADMQSAEERESLRDQALSFLVSDDPIQAEFFAKQLLFSEDKAKLNVTNITEEDKESILLLTRCFYRQGQYRRVIDYLHRFDLLSPFEQVKTVSRNNHIDDVSSDTREIENEFNFLNVPASSKNTTKSSQLMQHHTLLFGNEFTPIESPKHTEGIIYKHSNSRCILMGARCLIKVGELKKARTLLASFLTRPSSDYSSLEDLIAEILKRLQKHYTENSLEYEVFGQLCLLFGKLLIDVNVPQSALLWLKAALFVDTSIVEGFDLVVYFEGYEKGLSTLAQLERYGCFEKKPQTHKIYKNILAKVNLEDSKVNGSSIDTIWQHFEASDRLDPVFLLGHILNSLNQIEISPIFQTSHFVAKYLPDSRLVPFAKGCYHFHKKDYTTAQGYFNNAVSPTHFDKLSICLNYESGKLLAKTLLLLSFTDKAMQTYRNINLMFPNRYEIHLAYGNTFLKDYDYVQAKMHYKIANDLADGKRFEVVNQLGFLYIQMRDYQKAESVLRPMCKHLLISSKYESLSPTIFYNLGHCQKKLSKFKAAIDCFLMVEAIANEEGIMRDVYACLGYCYNALLHTKVISGNDDVVSYNKDLLLLARHYYNLSSQYECSDQQQSSGDRSGADEIERAKKECTNELLRSLICGSLEDSAVVDLNFDPSQCSNTVISALSRQKTEEIAQSLLACLEEDGSGYDRQSKYVVADNEIGQGRRKNNSDIFFRKASCHRGQLALREREPDYDPRRGDAMSPLPKFDLDNMSEFEISPRYSIDNTNDLGTRDSGDLIDESF